MAINMWSSKRDTQTSSKSSSHQSHSMIRSVDVQDLLIDKLISIEQTVGKIKTEHTLAALNTLATCKRAINQIISKQAGQDVDESLAESTSLKP